MNGVIVAYCRKSRQIEEDELDRQIQLVKKYADSKHYNLFKVYAEVGSSVDNNRLEYRKMIHLLQTSTNCKVIVTDIDRLARDTIMLGIFKQMCKERSHVVELVNGTVYNYSDYTDSFTSDIIACVSSYLYQQTRDKMQRGMNNFMNEGGKIGAVPIGYVRKDKYTYEIDLNKAEGIKFIFTEIARGLSTKEVVIKLDSMNFRTSNNKKLGTREVRNIIKNPIYYTNEPQIVSKELFVLANSKLRNFKNAGNKRSYPLSGKIICSKCGSSLIIGFKKDRDKVVVNCCRSSDSVRGIKSTCPCMGINYSIVESAVLSDCTAYLEKILSEKYDILKEDKKVLSEYQEEADNIKAEIEVNNKALSRINKLFVLGNIDDNTMVEMSKEYKDNIFLLEARLNNIKSYTAYDMMLDLQEEIIRLEELKDTKDLTMLFTIVDHVEYWRDSMGIQVHTIFKTN